MKKVIILVGILTLLTILIAFTIKTSNPKYKDSEGNKYKYQLELTGKMPNSEKEITFSILSNDNTLTFNKVSKSLYSNNSKDSEGIEYYLLSEK